MSNRRSNWMTSSLPRPTALNSPSLGRLSDIKGRLSFSAMKTPAFKPKQRSLVDHARSSASPVNGYHMSKQNPDVLDRLCSPSPSHRDTLLHKKTLSPAMVRVGAGSSMLMSARNGHQAPGQSSLVKQMLNDKHRAPTSLVHLATRGKTFRSGVNISPVIVKLSGATTYDLPSNSTSSLNSNREESSSAENGAEAGLRSTNGEGSPVKTRDPCDKNVVMSALRQRRKRWATSGPDDDSDHTPSTSDSGGAPLAKRTKHSSQDSDAQRPFNKHKSPLSYILGDRKRAYTAPSYSMSPDSKKSRLGPEGDSGGLVAPLPVRSGGGKKVSLPDFEFDGESELSECSEAGERESSGGVSSKASSRAPSECIGGLEIDGLQQQRSLTPPVQFDEAEINRKREESLSNLKAVFSPKGGDKKSSNRRKLPIFCATGNKPHLPTPLSTTHTVTQEDLKKDREAAAAKLREILTAEDPPPQTTVSMTSLTSLSSQTTLSLSTATAGSTSKDTSNLISGVRLSSSLSGSLPSLPSASSVTKNSSSLSTAIGGTGGGSLSLTMPKSTPPAQSTSASSVSLSSALPKSSLAQTTTATAVPPSTQPLQVKSVSFAPLPVPTPASTTQANFAFPTLLSNGSQVNQAAGQPPSTAITLSAPQASTGLTLGTNASISMAGTQLQLPQFSFALATTTTSTASAGNTLNTNATLQNSQASTTGGGGGLTLTQGINFAPQQSVGFSLPGSGNSNNATQLSIFQGSSTSSASGSVPSTTNATALALVPGAAGGSIFSGANSTTNAPSTGVPGGFTFALPTTTQQSQQQQQSNSLLQGTKPMSSTANSLANTNSIFGMSSGLQMPAVSQSQQTSSTGTNGGLIFQAQPQQQQQPSIFGGAQAQDSQKSSSGISFNFSQTPANNGGSGSGLAASSNTGLNFTAAAQQAQAQNPTFNFSAGGLNGSGQQQQSASGGSGLKLNTGSQSSGGGLSLFNNKPGNNQQQNQSSIFSAGASTQQQPSQPTNSAGGLFNNQQQSTASGFTGFKFSAGADNSQTQQGSSFPSFNAGSQASGSSAGFNFSAGASNAGGGVGGGLFQKSGSTPAQTNNQLATGSSTQKSGVSFNFSASAMGNQQQQTPQQQQPQQSQSQGGVFAFGQKPNSSSGFNFSANGSSGLGLGNQSQNGSSGFNFSAGMGMNPGGGAGAGTSGGVFNSSNSSQSNIFQNQVQQQQPNSNVFQTPQPQKQLSFTTPTNQPGQGGFHFQPNPSGLNISFSAGTPGDSGSARPVARARRRKK